MKKQIAILGSTGSIGTQALEVVAAHPDLFEVYCLTANNQADLLIRQALQFRPNTVVIANEAHYEKVRDALQDHDIKVFAGASALCEVVEMPGVDIVLTAMVGYAGLAPTLRAIAAHKTIALANKETLVVAGDLVCRKVQEYKTAILPVDSEHSAIFQCLAGEAGNPIEKILLTASGGPFRTKSLEEMAKVTRRDALKHPNWSMGAKITIDSASMMNKGFEAIEARWLFGVPMSRIEILVHPQSIVHSMVQFRDGSVKAQLGAPDMRLPIQYAFTYPDRVETDFPRADFAALGQLTFERPDVQRFRNLQLAFDAAARGGNAPCILNAANEVAVSAFLHDRIGFLAMSDLIADTMAGAAFVEHPGYEDYVASDAEARQLASSLLTKYL
ncbi:MAG: 1-deoxy-D-xylulose-5-phosphate reductoisomerase [Paludibacteraceae bacterium]|nr:1-deoxy-D-xylulose-5-phosphate reductoisomerase [Paludibacteraceae bacterium]